MRTVYLSHVYDTSPSAVWRVATDLDCLQRAVRGVLLFEGMPSCAIAQGQIIDVTVSMFGVLPAQPYRMEVIAFDEDTLTFTSREKGMGVEHFQHNLRIVPHPRGAELIDEVEIEAGWRTPMIAAWVRFMYKRRHKPRLEMLKI